MGVGRLDCAFSVECKESYSRWFFVALMLSGWVGCVSLMCPASFLLLIVTVLCGLGGGRSGGVDLEHRGG